MIKAHVYRSAWGDLWLVDIYDEDEGSAGDEEFLGGSSFIDWEYAMRWANHEVGKHRRGAAFRKFKERMRDLSETLRKLGLA